MAAQQPLWGAASNFPISPLWQQHCWVTWDRVLRTSLQETQTKGFHPRKSNGVQFNNKSLSTVEGSLQNIVGKYQGRNESSNSPPTWVWCPLWKDGSHCGLSGPQDVPCDCKTARTVPPATTPTTQWGCSNCSPSRFLKKQASIFTPALQSHLLLFCSTLLSLGCWFGNTKSNSRVRAWVPVSDWLHYQVTTWDIQQVPLKSLSVCLKKSVLRLTAALDNSSKYTL